MLIVEKLTYRIGGRLILDHASAAISDGRKVGLIGRNGAGKTTLLNLVLQELEPESGEIELSKSWRLGAVAQEAPAGPSSLIDWVLDADSERKTLLIEAETAQDPTRIGEIHARLNEIGAHSAPARAARILAGLGFPDDQQQRPCAEFSGGWRMRVSLAAVLFSAPDLLLLDEPTNYLDLEGALWLEDYLKRYRGTVILVSHDRDLLNRAVDSILHLEHGKLTLYSGGYDAFVEALEQKRLLDAAARARQENERKRIQAFVDRFRYKASKARQAQSRIKMLQRMKPITLTTGERLAQIKLPQPAPAAPPLLTLDDVSVGYAPGKPVLSHLTLRIDPDDRIALLGKNGNGKSTLAKLIADRLARQSGDLVRARKLICGYFAQHQLEELDPSQSPVETLSHARPHFDDTTLRTRLGAVGFSGNKADTKISNLSGGERARLMLAMATLDKPNLLVLDEPTNHLDIDARDELLEALNEFEGAVILISHDRRLVEGVADRLLLVADGSAKDFDGDIDEYKKLVLSKTTPQTTDKRNAGASKADQRREAAGYRAKIRPLKAAMDKAEREMAILQSRLEELDAALAEPELFVKEPAKGEDLSKQRAETTSAISAAETRWIEAVDRFESAKAAQSQ
ncbi:MAG: ATP-binding cassette domain-containing protein [Micropepsaceae bacterium]